MSAVVTPLTMTESLRVNDRKRWGRGTAGIVLPSHKEREHESAARARAFAERADPAARRWTLRARRPPGGREWPARAARPAARAGRRTAIHMDARQHVRRRALVGTAAGRSPAAPRGAVRRARGRRSRRVVARARAARSDEWDTPEKLAVALSRRASPGSAAPCSRRASSSPRRGAGACASSSSTASSASRTSAATTC